MILRALRTLVSLAAAAAAIGLLVFVLLGTWRSRVPPGPTTPVLPVVPPGASIHTVAAVRVPVVETSVGTVRAVHEIAIGSRLLARVRAMKVEKAGTWVAKGDVLVELDDEDLRARRGQAEAAKGAAAAELAQALIDLERDRRLAERGAVSRGKVEEDELRVKTAEAAVERSARTIAEAEAALADATVRAPIDGVVIEKHANEGDLATPGRVLVTMYDPSRMQLVASVRERTALGLAVGQPVAVELEALGETCTGTIDQIVPEAEAATRSFLVKVVGPCPPGVVSGMFGRLLVPIGDREEIRIPAGAVRSVGQVDLVYAVVDGDRILRRFVLLGRRTGDEIEVLSGLVPGDRILAVPGEVRP